MLHRSLRFVQLVFAFVVLPSRAAAQSPAVRPGIDSLFTRWIAPDAPGCAVGVYEGDRVVYARGYGLANVEHSVPVTPKTIFRIGALSSQFTALAVVLLAQDGKLSLDDPARKHVPEVPDFGGTPITIRHLLNHVSGLREFYALAPVMGAVYGDVVSTARNLDYLRHQKSLNFPTGTRFSKANIEYTLLDEIVSRVSGQTLAAFARARIFEPLGMTHTAYLAPDAVVPHHATAYQGIAGAWRTAEPNEAGGGANTSVEDLVRWHANVINHQIGGDAGWAVMTQRARLISGDSIPYGFGLQHLEFRGQRFVGHQTRFAGYHASLIHSSAFGGGVAVLCNRPIPNGPAVSDEWGGSPPMVLAQAVAVAAWPTRFTARSAPPPPSVRIALAPFAGVYFDSATRMLHQLNISGDTISAGRLGVLRLIGPDTYVSNSGWAVQPLLPATAGGPHRLIVTNTRGPYRPTITLTRIGTSWRPTPADLMAYAGRYYSVELDATITITVAGGALLVTPRYGGVPFRVTAVQKDLFAMLDPGGNFRFLRDSAGRIAQLEVNPTHGTNGVLFQPVR